MGRDEAVGHVVRRYLRAFGPAPRTDVADWAGLPASEVARALGRMRLRIVRGGGRRGVARPAPRAAAGPRDAGAAALPAHLGRGAAGPRAPGRRAARGVPAADLQHADAGVAADLPGRRRRGRDLAARGRAHRSRSLPAAVERRSGARSTRRPSGCRLPRPGRGAGLGWPPSPSWRVKTRQALWPPKPNEFEIATSTRARRGVSDVVEGRLGVGVLQVQGGREHLAREGDQGGDRLEPAGGAEGVAVGRLRRRHGRAGQPRAAPARAPRRGRRPASSVAWALT